MMFRQWWDQFLRKLAYRKEKREYDKHTQRPDWGTNVQTLEWFIERLGQWDFQGIQRSQLREIRITSHYRNIDNLILRLMEWSEAANSTKPLTFRAPPLSIADTISLDQYLVTNRSLLIQPKEAARALLDSLRPLLFDLSAIRSSDDDRKVIMLNHYERQTTHLVAELHGLLDGLYRLEQLTR